MNKLILHLIQYYNERYCVLYKRIAINIVTCKESLSFSISENIYRGRVNEVYREREKISRAREICDGISEVRFPSANRRVFSIGGFVTFIPTRKLASRRVVTRSRRLIVSLCARALLLLMGTASRRSPTSRCQRPFICTFHRRSSKRDSVNSQVNIIPGESSIPCISVKILN